MFPLPLTGTNGPTMQLSMFGTIPSDFSPGLTQGFECLACLEEGARPSLPSYQVGLH